MEQSTIDTETETPKRPMFLTVLCILTFIFSALTIINGIASALMSNMVGQNAMAVKQLDSISNIMTMDSLVSPQEKAGQQFVEKMIESTISAITPEKIRNAAFANIAYGVFTLLGALLMWRLRKSGFWIYVLGVIIAIAAPVAIYGTGNWLGLISSIGMGLVGLVFIILYAVNIKHLVK